MKWTILSVATAAAFCISAFSADAPPFRGSLLDTLNRAWSTYDSSTILSHIGMRGVQYFGKYVNRDWILRDIQNDSRTYVQNTIKVHDETFTREVNGNSVTESVFQDQQSVERSGRRHNACVQLTIVYDAASQELISTSMKVVPHGSWQVAKQTTSPTLKSVPDQTPSAPEPTALTPSVPKEKEELPPLGGEKVGMTGTYVGDLPFGQQLKHVELEVVEVNNGQLTAILRIPSENNSFRYRGRREAYHGYLQLVLEKSVPKDLLPFNKAANISATYHEFDHEITFNEMNFPPCTLVESGEVGRHQLQESKNHPSGQAAVGAVDPNNITGVYIGTYITGQSLLNLELQIDRSSDEKSVEGVFLCYTPGGTAKESLGSARLKGEYDPQKHLLTLTAYQWSSGLGAQNLSGLTGSFEPNTGKISGNLLPEKEASFEAMRDSVRTAQRQADVNNAARQFAEAPTSIWDARGTDERCRVILRWVSRLEKEYPKLDFYHTPDVEAIPKLINLFTDECFVPVFGKPYEQMDKDDRERIKRLLRECWLDRNFESQFTWHKGYLEYPFVLEVGTNMSHALVAPAVAFRRLKRNQLRQAMAELKAVPSTSDGYDRILSIQTEQTVKKPEDVDLLWPSERSGFEEAVQVAKKRVAEGALTMRLDQALAGTTGYDGMIKLQQAVAANSDLFEIVPPAVRDQQNAKVGEKIHSELKPLMADERQRIDQLGAGGEALKNGSRWYSAFSQRYLSHFHDPEIEETLAHFNQRRQADLHSGEAAMMTAIAQATSQSMIKDVLADYLGAPSDQRSEVARRVQAAADSRGEDIAWEAEKMKYSVNELKWMHGQHGVIALPSPVPTPEPREVALAVLRAFATHGEMIGPNTVKYVPFEFWKGLSYIIDVKHVELAPPEPDQSGGYLCTFRVFCHMTMGGNFDLDSSPQAAIMRNLFAVMNSSEPDPIHTKLVLTTSGWRSPDLDLQVSVNSFDFLFKR